MLAGAGFDVTAHTHTERERVHYITVRDRQKPVNSYVVTRSNLSAAGEQQRQRGVALLRCYTQLGVATATRSHTSPRTLTQLSLCHTLSHILSW